VVVKAIGWLSLVVLPALAACAAGPVRPVPPSAPTPPGREVVVPFEPGGDRDVFARVGDVVVLEGGGAVVAVAPSGTPTVRQVGSGAQFAIERLGIVEITVDQGGQQMRIWIRSYMEPWQPYAVPFVNGSIQVVYPMVSQVVVVKGGGTAAITPPGVVRQEGTDSRFVVERVGYATITIQRGRQRMVIFVRSLPK
jgi:hypothetical protein